MADQDMWFSSSWTGEQLNGKSIQFHRATPRGPADLLAGLLVVRTRPADGKMSIGIEHRDQLGAEFVTTQFELTEGLAAQIENSPDPGISDFVLEPALEPFSANR